MDINTVVSGSTANLYKLSDGQTSLLLECGLTLNKMREKGVKLGDVSGCLVSHEHKDHAKGVLDLLNVGVPIFCSQGTAKAKDIYNSNNCNIVKHKKEFRLGTFVIKPFNAAHDANEPLGFFIYSIKTGERLLFATDTYYIEPKLDKLKYLMVECSYIEEILYNKLDELEDFYVNRLQESHLSLEMLLDYLEKLDTSKLKEVHILHVSGRVGNKKEIKRQVQRKVGVPVRI